MTAVADRPTEFAEEAMETLRALRRHQAGNCPQCRTDPAWCETNKTYARNFEHAYEQWEAHRAK